VIRSNGDPYDQCRPSAETCVVPANEDAGRRAALLAFGHLLKRLRIGADLTQEELAERANVSARAISDLERGSIHRPRRDTAELLADGLRLRGDDRESFIALARGRPLPATEGAADRGQQRLALPHPPHAIVGRLKETAAATALLLDPEVRLLTLTGTGGVGKTRLALEVAFRTAEAMPDGAVFVDLAPVRGPELVLGAIAQALGVVAGPEQSLWQVVTHALRDQRLLLLLDNFEHVAPAATVVSDLLAACPLSTVLATSREPLRIRAEREYQVGPLVLPDLRQIPALDELGRVPAVDLFVRRAEAANRQFALTAENAGAIAEIAVRLDGLPLAIELAATRVKILSPVALLTRLEHRLPLLTGGARDLPARQQALRATIDWSHDLLSPEEQALFRRLAAFSGGCTLEAAEEVSRGVEETQSRAEHGKTARRQDGQDGRTSASQHPAPSGQNPPPTTYDPRPTTLDQIMALVDKNLLSLSDGPDGEQRFGMLETIREYGLERLTASGESAAVRDAHARWCLAFAQRADPALREHAQTIWLARLTIEHDNLRAALSWALERRNAELAQRLGVALAWFWRVRGYFDEGRRWLEQALALDAEASPTVRASALVDLARLAYQQGDYSGVPWLEEALATFRAEENSAGVASALATLGIILDDMGDHDRAAVLEDEALALFRALDDQPSVVRTLNSRGLTAWDRGDYDQAQGLLEEALALARSLGSWYTVAQALNNLALVAYEQRDYDRAASLQAEALDLYRELDNLDGLAHSLENFAMITGARDDAERSARLFGAATALRARIGAPGRPSDHIFLERGMTAASNALGAEAYAKAWTEGESMPLDEALEYALG
jgi:predicted ATPase/DNA-binding XRE family transcriptional regulator